CARHGSPYWYFDVW
nr:immunoglobulin heavy chain junction region [Mus musculus]MBK4184525.1 immunoglobulin heavy chain junction region [Mus musculus]MBK4184526.1 immunoglobulin heavy chain junction region [Mus musculus]